MKNYWDWESKTLFKGNHVAKVPRSLQDTETPGQPETLPVSGTLRTNLSHVFDCGGLIRTQLWKPSHGGLHREIAKQMQVTEDSAVMLTDLPVAYVKSQFIWAYYTQWARMTPWNVLWSVFLPGQGCCYHHRVQAVGPFDAFNLSLPTRGFAWI